MQYRIGSLRKLQFLMLPLFSGVFFILLFILVTINNASVDITIYVVLFIMFIGISFVPILFYFNFLKYNRDCVLETQDEWFRIRVDGAYHQIEYDKIDGINEYLNGKVTPWYFCEYWIVKANNQEFLITSLLISRNDFFVRFPVAEKLERHDQFLPFVK